MHIDTSIELGNISPFWFNNFIERLVGIIPAIQPELNFPITFLHF
jgi:hypothetical protein